MKNQLSATPKHKLIVWQKLHLFLRCEAQDLTLENND